MMIGKTAAFMIMIILAAGCIGTTRPVKVSASDGLQINDFSADINDVYSGEQVRLNLEVENIGGTTARNVKTTLFGSVDIWNPQPMPDSSNSLLAEQMKPPVIGSNTPGEFTRRIWTVTAPYLPEGLSESYSIGVRAGYDYTTTSVTPLDIITYDQFDLLRKQGGFAQTATFSQNSNAPIKIQLDALSPVRPRSQCTSSVCPGIKETFTLTLVNIGSGVPFKFGTDIKDFNSDNIGDVELHIKATKGSLVCDTGATDGSGGTIKISSSDPDDAQKTLRLTRGFGSVKIPCTFSIPANELTAGVPKDSLTVQITAKYSYAIDKTIPIKVTSNGEAAPPPSAASAAAGGTTKPGSDATTAPKSTIIAGTVRVMANSLEYTKVDVGVYKLANSDDTTKGGVFIGSATLGEISLPSTQNQDVSYSMDGLPDDPRYIVVATVKNMESTLGKSDHAIDCNTAPNGGVSRDCVVTIDPTTKTGRQDFTITLKLA